MKPDRKCHLCNDPAVAVFRFSRGCYCDPATVQPLCLHHAHRSVPAGGGSMDLIEDLTVGGEFGRYWASR
jgi:hypothetical protein